jgi:lipoate-protein ligase A
LVDIFFSTSRFAPFNLAAESYFLHEHPREVVLIYINSPSVIVGKHQNAYAETNTAYCKERGIGVYRRLSGGGTVFHDEGNINFSFIQNANDGQRLIDFARFLRPVQSFLQSRGVDAIFSGRNDLLVDGYKISGNAEHVFQKSKRIIHHGTLLYNSKLGDLKEAIYPFGGATYTSKAISSVRSKVVNIKAHCRLKDDTESFALALRDYFLDHFNGALASFDSIEKNIQKLVDEKFDTWEWNYGYSPNYSVAFALGQTKLEFSVKRGIITEIELPKPNELFEIGELIGCKHEPNQIRERLNSILKTTYSEKDILSVF